VDGCTAGHSLLCVPCMRTGGVGGRRWRVLTGLCGGMCAVRYDSFFEDREALKLGKGQLTYVKYEDLMQSPTQVRSLVRPCGFWFGPLCVRAVSR
jgi:hypothetical protein